MKNVLIVSNDHAHTIKLQKFAENFQEVVITKSTNVSTVRDILGSNNISLVLMDLDLLNEENINLLGPSYLSSQFLGADLYKSDHEAGSDGDKDQDNLIDTNYSKKQHKKHKYFMLKNGNKKEIIHFEKILWLEAEGNYTFINTQETKYVLKKPLKKMIEELDERFGQCHKKYCVNINYVQSIKRTQVVLKNKKEIPMTYFFKKNFMFKMQNTL